MDNPGLMKFPWTRAPAPWTRSTDRGPIPPIFQ
jgi:hypothetical protein